MKHIVETHHHTSASPGREQIHGIDCLDAKVLVGSTVAAKDLVKVLRRTFQQNSVRRLKQNDLPPWCCNDAPN